MMAKKKSKNNKSKKNAELSPEALNEIEPGQENPQKQKKKHTPPAIAGHVLDIDDDIYADSGSGEAKQKEPTLAPRATRPVINPAIWLVLLAIPLAYGLFIGFTQGRPDDQELERRAEIQEQRNAQGMALDARMLKSSDNTTQQSPGTGAPTNNRNRQQIAQIAQQATPLKPKTYTCDFTPWIRMKLTQDMVSAVKSTARPHRLLKEGMEESLAAESKTGKKNPARVNFFLSNDGVITSVKCG